MKVPADLSGDRLILDYLTRVTVAGTRYLPKSSRIAFVGNTRNRIEREIGPTGPADPAHVRDVLARLGEPEDLVKAERARLDAERLSRQSRARGAGDAGEAPVEAPAEFRPLNPRWRPATWVRPSRRRGAAGDRKRKGRLGGLLTDRLGIHLAERGHPARPGAQEPSAATAQSPAGLGSSSPDAMGTQPLSRIGTQAPAGTGNQAPAGTGTQAPGEAGTGASTRGSGTEGGGPPPLGPNGWLLPTAVIPPAAGSRQAGSAGPAGGDTPVHGTPVLHPGPREPQEPLAIRARAAALGHGAAQLATDGVRLARRYPLETATVTLLAVGGLILPFPYWLFAGLLGGVLAIWSPMWLPREKWIAVVGPLVVVIVGTILAAVVTGGHGGVVAAYPHEFRLDAGDILRLGNVMTAAYLVVQARRAPQRRLPPWQRQRPPPPPRPRR